MTVTPPSQKPLPYWPQKQFTARRLGYWLSGLSIGLLLATLFGRLLGHYYFFELFSHFRVQYVWLAYGLIGLAIIYGLVYRREIAWKPFVSLLILLLLVISQNRTTWIPGDPAAEKPIPVGDVRVFHANVLYTRDEYETTVALIRKQRPNLYVLQEMTPRSIRLVTAKLQNEFPYWFACWSKGPCWVLVGSRTPFLVDRALARKWRVVSLKTRINGRAIALITVHPRTPVLPSWFRERNDQLAYVAKATRQNTLPTILIGDFNISVFSPIYKELFQASEPTSTGLVTKKTPSLQALRNTRTQPTWPRFLPPMMIPIDHAFVNDKFRPIRLQTLAQPGSDHKAVVADISFIP